MWHGYMRRCAIAAVCTPIVATSQSRLQVSRCALGACARPLPSPRPLRPLRGKLGRCLPPDPRQTDSVEDGGEGTGERVRVAGYYWCGRQNGAWRGRRCHGAADCFPSPGPMTLAMCVWRGSGGRHPPSFPRRGRRGREKDLSRFPRRRAGPKEGRLFADRGGYRTGTCSCGAGSRRVSRSGRRSTSQPRRRTPISSRPRAGAISCSVV